MNLVSSLHRLRPTHHIYVSRATNPFFNLSLEDWLFRHHPPQSPLLLLYRDSPCVVVGRNQNPWKELDLVAARDRGIPWIRRRSGGGTVYHDEGNTNYSIHTPRAAFDRHATAQVVLRALLGLGLHQARVNDRNDLCLGKDKVSGSAYKIVNNRAYHHGTMLISTQLDTLGQLLRVTGKEMMETKGVASVRSPVCNLRQASEAISHELFVDQVIHEFRREYNIQDEHKVQYVDETGEIEYINKGIEELKSWEWAYGQTPEFSYRVKNSFPWGDVEATIRSKHGIILSCDIPGHQTLGQQLVDKRYGFVDDAGLELGNDSKEKQVWDWLRGVMSH